MADFTSAGMQNVLNFCYTGRHEELTDENIEETLMTCRDILRGLQILQSHCAAYLSRYNIENALPYYRICQKFKISPLSIEIWSFICNNFESISRTLSYLRSDKDNVIQLLSEDCLIVPEMSVFQAAIAWLENQGKECESVALQVLDTVRFSLINPLDIVKEVEPKLAQLTLSKTEMYGILYRAMA